jgi:hypothetical protein
MCRIFPARALISIFVLSISLCAQTTSNNSISRVYVGILDDAREEMVNWKPGIADKRVIRPAFEKTSTGWKQADPSSWPADMNWRAGFDGREIGQLESQPDSEGGLTSFQNILSSDVPSVGLPSQKFAGLLGDGPTKVRRPLVVVSEPNFRDPDAWKRTKLPIDVTLLIQNAFRREYPHVGRCKDEKVVDPNWKFPNSALTFPAAYASNKQTFLARASLDAGECGWVDQPEDPLSEPWFFVSEDLTVRRIGSFMSLLDAGDYDNDGRSEVVFFLTQGENTDGFVLFDSSFEKSVSLLWHYH